MLKSLRAFLDLPAADRFLLLQATFVIYWIRLALKFLPFERVRHHVARLAGAHARLQIEPHAPRRVVWAVAVASQVLPGHVTCLPRALAGQVLFERMGLSTKLHIGFSKRADGTVEGHAWLECEGQVVIGDNGELALFTSLSSLR